MDAADPSPRPSPTRDSGRQPTGAAPADGGKQFVVGERVYSAASGYSAATNILVYGKYASQEAATAADWSGPGIVFSRCQNRREAVVLGAPSQMTPVWVETHNHKYVYITGRYLTRRPPAERSRRPAAETPDDWFEMAIPAPSRRAV